MNKILCNTMLLLLGCLFGFAQVNNTELNNDYLSNITFQELKNKFYENENNSNTASIYAKMYLKKAKKNMDTIKIADGYYFLGAVEEYNIAYQYADSIIHLTQNLINKEYPGFGYKLKGNLLFMEGDYKKAFHEYVIASEFAKKRNNELEYVILKFNIGLLKNQLGERKEALGFFKQYVDYISEKELKKERPDLYIKGLYALSESYSYNSKLDSAELFIKEGVIETIESKDTLMYNLFVLQSGINYYFQNKYKIAVDSLTKAEKQINSFSEKDKMGIAICNYYIGKSLLNQGNTKKGIYHFKKVDTLLHELNNITPELIDTYTVLIKHYKNKNDDKSQIKYITSLIKFDSILESNYKFLSKKIIRNYESKELLDEKNQLIEKLNNTAILSKKNSLILGIIIIALITIVLIILKKNRVYKKRFESIMNKNASSHTRQKDTKKTAILTQGLNLPEELVKEVLEKLEVFEASKRFLNKKYTLNSLAKELNTNSSYLSKIINETKQINFANYLNDLKIEEAIKRLKNEKQLRAYTIESIATEMGFNTAQSFSQAFYKKTGLHPSYFIKSINNQKVKN
ncbi:helix-turn-helix domain-containing protein [Aquimarina pacifica]|uniref:helix-turn-helix domain-containing protein n=1 Tax=Aquimarina pacifica TaxID=1296415 RepID=UPI000471F4D8|nr:helix-turn-helix domain-containing protein [Aquimarina pacifica]